MDFGIEDLQVEPRDEAKIFELFTELEFKTLIKSKVDKSTPKAKPTEPPESLKKETPKLKDINASYECILKKQILML